MNNFCNDLRFVRVTESARAVEDEKRSTNSFSSQMWSLLGSCLKVLGYSAAKNWSKSQAEGSITINAQQAAGQTFTYKERTNNINYICKDLKHLQL